MKQLTKDEAVKLHRKMWRWIAEETEKQGRKVLKMEYFKSMEVDENDIPFEECYCCEFVSQLREHTSRCCESCPLDWGTGYGYMTGYKESGCTYVIYAELKHVDGYFCRWADAKAPEKAAKLARIIAELPEKEEK